MRTLQVCNLVAEEIKLQLHTLLLLFGCLHLRQFLQEDGDRIERVLFENFVELFALLRYFTAHCAHFVGQAIHFAARNRRDSLVVRGDIREDLTEFIKQPT